MFFQRVNRSDPEKVFISVKNSYSTAAITVGQVVAWDYTTDADGVGVTRPTTALLKCTAGVVVDASVAASEYGLIQTYGHNADALVDGTSGLAAGGALIGKNATFNFDKYSTGHSIAFCGETYSTGAAAVKKVFLRCM